MATKSRIQFLSTIALAMSLLFAVFAFASSPPQVSGSVPGTMAGAMPPMQRSGPDIPLGVTIADAKLWLNVEAPSAGAVIDVVEQADVDALMSHIAWQPIQCFPDGGRDGSRPVCNPTNAASGVVMAMPELPGNYFRDQAGTAVLFEELLHLRNPRLELVSERADGAIYLAFSIAERPHRVSGALVAWIGLELKQSGGQWRVLSVWQGVPSHTSLDVVEDESYGGLTHEIYAASAELLARNAAKNADRARARSMP